MSIQILSNLNYPIGNAIPDNFYQLEYDEFLQKRRKLMAGVIRKAFNKI